MSNEYKAGQRYRVIKPGASISGMKPIAPNVQQGFVRKLQVGDVLTCRGTSMTFGDGVPIVKWADEKNEWICNDADFSPSTGGMWNRRPDDSYLEPIESAGVVQPATAGQRAEAPASVGATSADSRTTEK